MPRAYDPNLDDPNENEDLEGGGTQTVAGPQGAGMGQAQAPQASDRGKPTQSGSWTNLDNYLQSNAGQGFGEKVAGRVGADVDAASGQIDSAAQEFKGRSDAGTTRADDDLLAGVGSDPTAIANDETKLAAFKKQRDAQYAGPSSFSDTADLYGKTWGAVDSASQKAKGSETEGGRYALLDNYFGRADYSQGQKGLDNLLVANDPNSRQAFENVRASADAAKQKFNTAGQDAAAYAAGNRGVTEKTKADTAATLASERAKQAAATKSEFDAYNARQDSAYDTAKARASEGVLDNRLASTLGRKDGPDWNYTYGLNLGDFVTDTAVGGDSGVGGRATLSQTLTPEMRSRLKALATLSDVDASTYIDGVDPNDASTYNNAGYSFDAPRFQAARDNAKTQAAKVAESDALKESGVPEAPTIRAEFNSANWQPTKANSITGMVEQLTKAKQVRAELESAGGYWGIGNDRVALDDYIRSLHASIPIAVAARDAKLKSARGKQYTIDDGGQQ